jgi:hypothetical protein
VSTILNGRRPAAPNSGQKPGEDEDEVLCSA